ncbi:hypothetical protein M3Y99_01135500 [Aphelenchoides fujianensis]|nr:hypothetical protein M3Y99_01135500 [Aphelenchoides fujianensis]
MSSDYLQSGALVSQWSGQTEANDEKTTGGSTSSLVSSIDFDDDEEEATETRRWPSASKAWKIYSMIVLFLMLTTCVLLTSHYFEQATIPELPPFPEWCGGRLNTSGEVREVVSKANSSIERVELLSNQTAVEE